MTDPASDSPLSENADLAAKLEALRGARVLVVGDLMLDRYVSGTVDRISPEAPIPILRAEHDATMLGGAGNVLRNLAALGARGRLVAAIGDDAAGAELRGLVEAAAADSGRLVVQTGRPTTVKVRYLGGGQQLLRIDHEETGPLADAQGAALLAAVDAELPEADVLVLSDYGKGVLTPESLRALLARAGAAGVPVVVDPKAADYAVYRRARVVTPNRRELERAIRLPAGSDAEVARAAAALAERAGIEAVLATRSERGMTLVEEGGVGTACHLPAEAREVYDVSGAGDTVVAALAAALAGGLTLLDAARLANVAAGIVVGKVGTAVARPEEMLRALHAARLMTAESKVASRDGALERLAAWRRAGLSVAFTNGCFDLLHPGHVSLLAQARASADKLVVGLNSDASVRRLKGAERPVQDEAARAAVLASLASVDLVLIFEEDTPLALLEALKPEVLVKGADYTRDTVVGADLVEGYGGKVVLAELAPGHSTTETIRRLRR